MSQTSDTQNAMQILSVGEERSAYRSGDGIVINSKLWNDDKSYIVVPADVSISPTLMEQLGVAIVLEKPVTELTEFSSSD